MTSASSGLPADFGAPSYDHDTIATHLSVDLQELRAVAIVEVEPTGARTTFSARALEFESITIGGAPARWRHHDARVDVELDGGDEIRFEYRFSPGAAGLLPGGTTLTWPTHCGELFPCDEHPSDGMTFSLELEGVPPGDVAVYPAAIDFPAPAYMLAWAVGPYSYVDLGSTLSGIETGAWVLPGHEDTVVAAAAALPEIMDFYETLLGPYEYGDAVASVEANWGGGQLGSMEYHPLWHISSASLGDPTIHAHVAAHGWFGNGIRLACWEDFVLSEGTASYLAARAIEAVGGDAAGEAVWSDYAATLEDAVALPIPQVAWPEGCGELDIEGFVSPIPSVKGAFFLRAVEEQVGRAEFDGALEAFYAGYRGRAASMDELLDVIATTTGHDPVPCAEAWLRGEDVPEGC